MKEFISYVRATCINYVILYSVMIVKRHAMKMRENFIGINRIIYIYLHFNRAAFDSLQVPFVPLFKCDIPLVHRGGQRFVFRV